MQGALAVVRVDAVVFNDAAVSRASQSKGDHVDPVVDRYVNALSDEEKLDLPLDPMWNAQYYRSCHTVRELVSLALQQLGHYHRSVGRPVPPTGRGVTAASHKASGRGPTRSWRGLPGAVATLAAPPLRIGLPPIAGGNALSPSATPSIGGAPRRPPGAYRAAVCARAVGAACSSTPRATRPAGVPRASRVPVQGPRSTPGWR